MERINRYLLDTNILIELLLDQEKADEVSDFLTKIPSQNCFITLFTIYSIGIILIRNKKQNIFNEIIDDLIFSSRIGIITLSLEELKMLPDISVKFNLDFDDSYQYLAAKTNNLILISFDSDFDHTILGRKAPKEIIDLL